MAGSEIRCIPDLLGYQADTTGKLLECPNVRLRITPGSQLVVASLTRQQRPRTADTPAVIRGAILTLAEAVVIVTAPARTVRRVDLEYLINSTQRVLDQWIMGITNTIADEFEKSGINDRLCRKFE